ncbi:MAG TPA: hypothetical protein VIV35_02670 [Chitinophagaceae bacterium]
MMNSRDLAKLIGPTIIAVTISETINVHIWAGNVAAGIHLNGGLLFLGGLSIIRIHNHWVRSWITLVTLVGWFILLLGLFRMFFPEMQLEGAKNTTMVTGLTMLVLAVGVFLTYKAFIGNVTSTENKKE